MNLAVKLPHCINNHLSLLYAIPFSTLQQIIKSKPQHSKLYNTKQTISNMSEPSEERPTQSQSRSLAEPNEERPSCSNPQGRRGGQGGRGSRGSRGWGRVRQSQSLQRNPPRTAHQPPVQSQPSPNAQRGRGGRVRRGHLSRSAERWAHRFRRDPDRIVVRRETAQSDNLFPFPLLPDRMTVTREPGVEEILREERLEEDEVLEIQMEIEAGEALDSDASDASSETSADRPQVLTGAAFVAALPTVPRASLGDDEADHQCVVCRLPYQEDPVVTECRHHFERGCLQRWLSEDGANQNSCPVCRRELFQQVRPQRPRRLRMISGEDGVGTLPFEPLVVPGFTGRLSTADMRDRINDNRRSGALHDHRLYQALARDGAYLPPLPPGGVMLNMREDRAMFLELQRRGAFALPGMDAQFREGSPENPALTDADIYNLLRNAGADWCLHHNTWRRGGGYHLRFEAGGGMGRPQRGRLDPLESL